MAGALRPLCLASIDRGDQVVTDGGIGVAQQGQISLTSVDKYINISNMPNRTRPVSWINAARKDFEDFPRDAQIEMARALAVVAAGGHPDIAKPLTGLGSGVLELALKHRGDAFRVVYVLQIDTDIWVVHAFQKKSKSGIATPKAEIDLIRERLKRLKEALR